MRRIVLLSVVVSLVAAGCGSKTSTYTAAKTRTCLVSNGATFGGKLDFVASTALGGAFVVHLQDDNFVTIAFGQKDADAIQLQLAYRQFARANVKRNISDVLLRYNNAITLWHMHPANTDSALVVGCLK